MIVPPMPFDEATLLSEARQVAGLSDFGDEAFRTPLRALLASLAEEPPLNASGVASIRGRILQSLVTRLRAEDWFARHPEILDERIERPLVIVGMTRTGTTLLQRLLASDPRHYSALAWEVREASPRPGTSWDQTDPRLADAEKGARRQREAAPEIAAIHPSGPHEAEEELMILEDTFLTHVPEASCPVPTYRSWLDEQDFTPVYLYLRRMLGFLQWQKKQRGERRGGWILKTPAHLGYLDTLFSVFPDAHVIHAHRSPLEAIPSGASLNLALWRMNCGDADPLEVGRQWKERMVWAIRRCLTVRDALSDAERRFTDVWFRDALSEPLAQMQRIYDAVGLELTSRARDHMQAWLRQHPRNRLPAHRYSLEQFGLTEAGLRQDFCEYMKRFIDPRQENLR